MPTQFTPKVGKLGGHLEGHVNNFQREIMREILVVALPHMCAVVAWYLKIVTAPTRH
jgi:hypothetical protein